MFDRVAKNCILVMFLVTQSLAAYIYVALEVLRGFL